MRSLRTKTVFWALIPTVLMLVVAMIGLYAYERVARNVILERDTELARVSAARLATDLRQYSRVLQSTVAKDGFQSMEPSHLSLVLEEAQNQLYVFDVGVVVYDGEGITLWSRPFVAQRQGTDYPIISDFEKVRRTQQPAFSNIFKDEISGKDVILVTVPIWGSGDEFKGVLAGMFEMKYPLFGTVYAEVLELKVGKNGFAYLVDGNGKVIYHPDEAQMGTKLANAELVMRAMKGESGAIVAEDSAGESVIFGFALVPGTGWGLITQERWEDVVGSIRGYSRLLLGLLALGGIISGVLIFFATSRTLKSITELAQGARRIAGGDFDHSISVKAGDEMQALAQQFNTMTSALKESYARLEQKTEERTRGERRRVEQLRAINEVGRRISSILSLDNLLAYVVNSLRETFNYYHVDILILEHDSNELVVKASTDVKGIVPIEFATRVKVTEGITGWVFGSGETLLANDVSKESRYLYIEPRLDTRSELAVPIKMGTEVLGVLDIESTELNAFDEIDLFTVQTLVDQVAVAIENARLYQETRDMAVLEERNRMAREIHDTLAQGFTGIVLQLEAAEQALDGDVARAQEHLDRARRLARESLNEARRSVWALRPQALEQFPLAETIRQEIEKFTQDSGLMVSFDTLGKRQILSPDIESALLRICQEALVNVRKHAQTSQAEVNLTFEEKAVRLSVHDNGVGFDPKVPTERAFGLIGMRERARLLRGTLVVQSERGKGTLIEVMIPIA